MPPLPDLGISKTEQDNMVMAKGGENTSASPGLSQNLEQTKGQGSSLDSETLQMMGQQIGADFSNVKIHTGEKAKGMNEELGAKAFTHGKDIYFNQGQFEPGSQEGKKLLAHELTHTVQQGAAPISPKLEDDRSKVSASASPSIQRGLLSDIGGAIGSGFGWVKDKVTQLGSAAWSSLKGFGGSIKEAWGKTNFKWSDLYTLGGRFLSRFSKNLTSTVFDKAMTTAERQMAIRAAGGTVDEGLVPDPTPGQLQVMRGAVENVQSVGDSVLGIQEELLEGAIIGDFNENPTIWNTIGQIAIGFVPYAGQVADARDLVAGIIKLEEGGWKRPWDWFNVILIGIGFIPGIGDAIKAAGRGLKGPIKKLGQFLGRNGDLLWKKGSTLVKKIWGGAKNFGRRALASATEFGSKMLTKARGFGSKMLGKIRGLGSRAKNFATGLGTRIANWGRKAREMASSALSRGRGLLSRIGGRIGSAVRGAYNTVKTKIGSAMSTVSGWIAKGRALVTRIRNGIATRFQQAKEFVQNGVRTAMRKGRALARLARIKAKAAWKRAQEIGQTIKANTWDRAVNYFQKAKKWVKEKAIKWVMTKIRLVRDRIKPFLKAKLEKIKRKLGLSQDVPTRSSTDMDDLATDPAHRRMTPKAATEREAALALEKKGNLPAPVTRSPDPKTDFIDGSGQKWDHKGFRSTVPHHHGRGAFVLNDALDTIADEFRKGNNLIIDSRDMSAEHIRQLRRAIAEKNWGDKILWYP